MVLGAVMDHFTAGAPVETWIEPAFALGRLPQKYNARGVRADRSPIFLVRLAGKVKLPKGDQTLLLPCPMDTSIWFPYQPLLGTPLTVAETESQLLSPPSFATTSAARTLPLSYSCVLKAGLDPTPRVSETWV